MVNLLNLIIYLYFYRLFLVDDVVNFIVVGRYFVKIIFKKFSNFIWFFDEIFIEKMYYNIFVYRFWCMFFDEGNNFLLIEGVKVNKFGYFY